MKPVRRMPLTSEITPEQTALVCAHVRRCLPLDMALDLADIAPATHVDWMSRGDAAASGDERCVKYMRELRHATAATVLELVGRVRDASTSDPAAALWLLERRADAMLVDVGG